MKKKLIAQITHFYLSFHILGLILSLGQVEIIPQYFPPSFRFNLKKKSYILFTNSLGNRLINILLFYFIHLFV